MAKLIRNGRAFAVSRDLLLEDRFENLGKLFHLQPLINVPKPGKVAGRTCLDASVRGRANISLNDACDREANDDYRPLVINPRLHDLCDLAVSVRLHI